MTWMVPLRRLDEAQQDVLRKCATTLDKPKWIEGFAGSGKTVLLVHAIQNYAVKNPDKKVCIVVFTHALKDLISSGIAPEMHGRIPVMTYLNFVNRDRNHYDLVVIDEVQDVPQKILAAIRKRSENIIVGGDDAQSIYASGSDAEEIQKTLEPERLVLPLVYRLTRKIINVVRGILPEAVIVTATSGRMEEFQVTLAHAEARSSELSWVWQQAKRLSETGDPSAIVLPNHDSIMSFMNFVATEEGLGSLEFPQDRWRRPTYDEANSKMLDTTATACLQYLGNSYGDLTLSETRPVVFVMTYHSIKGLDFKTVFLPLLTNGVQFWREDKEEAAGIDRRLFFVGATRSRKDLFLSYNGDTPHQYVLSMPQSELHKIEIELDAADEEEVFEF